MNARTLLLLAAGAVLALPACNNVTRPFCEAAANCDEFLAFDPVGSSDDSVDVCIVDQETKLRALRASSENICQDLADATEAFMVCAGEQGDCDGFQLVQNDCSDEIGDVQDLTERAGDDCNE